MQSYCSKGTKFFSLHKQNNFMLQPKQSNLYEVGAILADTWGCEQTNKDFYCIVKRSGDWVTVLPMTKKTTHNAEAMTSINEPGAIDYTAKPIRKRLYIYNNEERGFTLRNYSGGGWCDLWNGKKQHASQYA